MLSQIDAKSEASKKMALLWKQHAGGQAQIQNANTEAAQLTKVLKANAEANQKAIAERGKQVAAGSKTAELTGKKLLEMEVERLAANRQLLMDFAFVQLQEHSQ